MTTIQCTPTQPQLIAVAKLEKSTLNARRTNRPHRFPPAPILSGQAFFLNEATAWNRMVGQFRRSEDADLRIHLQRLPRALRADRARQWEWGVLSQVQQCAEDPAILRLQQPARSGFDWRVHLQRLWLRVWLHPLVLRLSLGPRYPSLPLPIRCSNPSNLVCAPLLTLRHPDRICFPSASAGKRKSAETPDWPVAIAKHAGFIAVKPAP